MYFLKLCVFASRSIGKIETGEKINRSDVNQQLLRALVLSKSECLPISRGDKRFSGLKKPRCVSQYPLYRMSVNVINYGRRK